MSGDEGRSTKVEAKLLSDLVSFLLIMSEIPLDFH